MFILTKQNNRFIAIILIIFLVLIFCMMSYSNAFAIAPLVVAGGVLLTAYIMSATGILFNDTQKANAGATQVYNSLSAKTKTHLNNASLIVGSSVILGQSAFGEIANSMYSYLQSDAVRQALLTGEMTSSLQSVNGKPMSLWLSQLGNPAKILQNIFAGYSTIEVGRYSSSGLVFESISLDSVGLIHIYSGGTGDGAYAFTSFPPIHGTGGNVFNYNESQWQSLLSTVFSVTYDKTEDGYTYYNCTYGVDTRPLRLNSTNIVSGMGEVLDYTIYPDYVIPGIVGQSVANGDIDINDVSSNVGTNSIGADTPITVPYEGTTLDDLISYSPSDVLSIPSTKDFTTDLSTGTIVGEGELVGEGEGTGVFGDMGKWALNLPFIGPIIALLQAILSKISAITEVSEFNIDFEPLKVDLTTVFPFCIPFDFVRLITVYSHSPADYAFSIDLDTDYWSIHHTVDLTPFRIPIIFFRWVVTLYFTYILISRTRDFMKW